MTAKVIMFQGTASDVGKSLLVAAVCRIYTNHGQRVFPFKSQNMALNSFVTREGHEMGRAQVFQAEASRRYPDVRMNPILLKPSTDSASQVIVQGKVLENMSASDYHDYKPKLRPIIQAIYQEIAQENDLIVIEGAGSPAEINLNDRDIVNMGMAEMADSPVILIADIDRGGVFASIYGTIELMNPEERQRIKGVIINKFRGDVKLLEPGLKMIEDLTNVPVIGVVPYMSLNIDSEDSVALESVPRIKDATKELDIVIVTLGKISNFTDFNSLSIQPDVSVRYVKTIQELGNPDLVILPGSKNTIEDMLELQASGMKQALLELASSGVSFIGICGGYQLLGKTISDPLSVETSIQSIEGLGLLNTHTVFEQEKNTYQSKARADGFELEGYEIHMGITRLEEDAVAFSEIHERNGQSISFADGAVNPTRQFLGTYLHGLFDNVAWARAYLNKIRVQKGLYVLETPSTSFAEIKEREYENLAQHVAQHIDLTQLNVIIESGM